MASFIQVRVLKKNPEWVVIREPLFRDKAILALNPLKDHADMNEKREERRKYKRVLFSMDDGIIGVFILPWRNGEVLSGSVMDLGAGGLHFVIPKEANHGLIPGRHLILKGFKGTRNLDFCADIELEVRWVLEHKMFEHTGVGCEFKKIPDHVRQQVDQFVLSERKFRGQHF